jgi:hypothetical protein
MMRDIRRVGGDGNDSCARPQLNGKMNHSTQSLCYVAYIKNAVNLDVGFPFMPEVEEYMSSTGHEGRVIKYVQYDNETLAMSEVRQFTVFRMRLSGVTEVTRDGNEKRKKEVSYFLINWNKRTGGIFKFTYVGIDRYDRILMRLADPVTGEDVAQKLIAEYGDYYTEYVSFTTVPQDKTRRSYQQRRIWRNEEI